jgi:hypothetical protein
VVAPRHARGKGAPVRGSGAAFGALEALTLPALFSLRKRLRKQAMPSGGVKTPLPVGFFRRVLVSSVQCECPPTGH